jgi:phosphatidate cytidylyltransferase
MLLRLISTILLVPPALAAIWFGRPYFEVMVFVVSAIAVYEWFRVTTTASLPVDRQPNRAGWLVFGIAYIAAAAGSLIQLRSDALDGRAFVVELFVIVWATDIGAYLVGRSVGGPKLAPAISPNKTWSGAFGGLACAVVAALVAARVMNIAQSDAIVAFAAATVSVASQVGDLLESWWKRRFHVKDSGHLIPGHGGILDRIDGVLLASPVAAAGHWVMQGGGMPWK